MRWLRALTVIGVLSLVPPVLVAAPAAAAPTWTPPEVLGFGGNDVQMDVGTSGDAVAAWTYEEGIKASYRPAGKDWQRPVVVERGASGVLDVFVDRRGVARVVWWDADVLGLATRGLTGRWRVDPAAAGTGGGCCWSSTPNVAADEDGNLVAMWQDINDLAGTYSNFYWRTPGGRWTSVGGGTSPYDADIVVHEGLATVVDGGHELRESSAQVNGDLLSRVIRSEGAFGTPALAGNTRGDMVLAVRHSSEANETVQVDEGLLLLTRTAGNEWRSLVSGAGQSIGDPRVAINDAGDLAVAYRRASDGAVVVRTGRMGGSLGGARVLGTSASRNDLSVAVAGDGAVAATWTRGPAERRRVFAATKPAGGSWRSPVRLGIQVPNQLYPPVGSPSVVAYPNGMFTAVFADGKAARWSDLVDDSVGPRARMRAPHRDYVQGTKFRVAWDATDQLARPDTYDVRYRSAGRGGKLGRWHRWLTDTEREDRRFTGKPGRTYCFAARSRDRVGNLGRWSAQRCTTTPLDDRAIAASSGSWDRVSSRPAYRDTLTVADRRGQTLRLDAVRATAVRLLVRTCRGCGEVVVEHGGKRIGAVDTASSRARNRVILVETYNRTRSGALVIRTGEDRPVRIDGVIATR